jgi:hypothetical protein
MEVHRFDDLLSVRFIICLKVDKGHDEDGKKKGSNKSTTLTP